MRIAVLMGGPSPEREISLKSGEAVYNALVSLGHQVLKIDLDDKVVSKLKNFGPDVVFNALHGKPGEDGSVQGMLEVLGIPYTGSGVLSSAISMDKVATKRMLEQAGIPTPKFMSWSIDEYSKNKEKINSTILKHLGLPVVIKAPTQGSTIGISIVKERKDLTPAIENALKYDPYFMAEVFLPGPEITASILGNKDPEVLPLIEITSHTGFYDYEAKYTPGLSEHIIPPRLPKTIIDKINLLAKKTYNLLGCRGFARIDFIVANKEKPQVIEINSVPGMTNTSLVPDAAKAAGLDFNLLIQKIIDLALETKNK
ncbi:MAG: D-alanine-D-alanine ligase [Clostridia bacterium]|nr:D-alanine-D-alanine ligase [Clostridia bacterium]